MHIYTSYYYQLRNFPPTLIGLNTTMFPPKYVTLNTQDQRGIWLLDCPPLRPDSSCANLCQGACNPKDPVHCAFLHKYRQQLDNIDFNKFTNQLTCLAGKLKQGENLDYVDFALIVFEAPTNCCSERYPLQSWLRDNGIQVEEWRPNM